MENGTLEWALYYADHGYRVIPIRPGQKRPPITAWQDTATSQTGVIRTWFEGIYRDHGIGIVTGHHEHGWRYFVLDIDLKDSDVGTTTLQHLEQKHGQLPDTIEAISGSGGRHLFYRLADHHLMPSNGAGRHLGPGIDVRGQNAQVLVAPTVHPNGNQYQWVDGAGIGEIEIATAPDWLVDMLNPDQPTPTPETRAIDIEDQRPGTVFNRSTTWDTLLHQDGWTPHHYDPQLDTYYWTRPGKQTRDGVSATVNHNGNDLLTVFTTSIHALPPGNYDRFGYFTATRYNGDHAAAARALANHDTNQIDRWLEQIQHEQPANLASDDDPNHHQLGNWYIDWTHFWQQDHNEQDWLCEPVLARGRGHALYAGAKSGKSLMLLEIAAGLATGKTALGTTPDRPVRVLYVDYEMSQSDVRDRLEAFGYTADDNLDNLYYALLPSIPGLDTPEGAKAIVDAVKINQIEMVVIDTTGRAVEGPENEADTLRAFYRWTGLALKSMGVTYVRADHAGKDTAKGQRGTSAKNDDVDVVWKFTKRSATGVLLEATHRRMSWIPEKVEIELRETAQGLRHQVLGGETPQAAIELADELDRLRVPVDMSIAQVRGVLKENNVKAANDTLRLAMKHRRTTAQVFAVSEQLVLPEAIADLYTPRTSADADDDLF